MFFVRKTLAEKTRFSYSAYFPVLGQGQYRKKIHCTILFFLALLWGKRFGSARFLFEFASAPCESGPRLLHGLPENVFFKQVLWQKHE